MRRPYYVSCLHPTIDKEQAWHISRVPSNHLPSGKKFAIPEKIRIFANQIFLIVDVRNNILIKRYGQTEI
jgi:hypothetical protein